MKRRLYDILGLSPNASQEDITLAARKAQKATHPDAGGDAKKFAEASHAIAVLRDPKKRAKYDATGEEDFEADNDTATVLSLISTELDRIIQQGENIIYLDVIQTLKEHFSKQISISKQNIETGKQVWAKLDAIFTRFKRKAERGGKIGLLEHLFLGKRRLFEQNEAGCKEQIRLFERVLESLEEYEFKKEAREADLSFNQATADYTQQSMSSSGLFGFHGGLG